MRLAFILLLLLQPSFLELQCLNIIQQAHLKNDVTHSKKADEYASKLLQAYLDGDQDYMDAVYEKMDHSWYAGVDFYVFEGDPLELISTIRDDDGAEFRFENKKRATIAIEEQDGTHIVLIFSFK